MSQSARCDVSNSTCPQPLSMVLLSSLPNELLDAVFALLSKSDLASISLVCHAWRSCAFPRLYHTVSISFAADLELMVSRIKYEDVTGPLSIVSYLQGLVFDEMFVLDRPDRRMIEEPDFIGLQAVISRLAGLTFLAWDLGFVPEDCRLFELFQRECPKLDFIRVDLQNEIEYPSGEYKSLLRLSGISEFSVKISYFSPELEDYANAWATVLNSSPNLSSFSIRFDGPEAVDFDVSSLVATLGNQFTRPHLHTFRACGYSTEEWGPFFDKSSLKAHPLRDFFKRHPNIQNVGLAYSYDVGNYRSYTMNPADIVQLFPSLRRFEGPDILIRPLLLSSLALQLETLTTSDYRLVNYWASHEGVNDRIGPMPHLRELSIQAHIGDAKTLLDVLSNFITAAPRLEKIEIPDLIVERLDFDHLVQKLQCASSLIEIALNKSLLKYIAFDGMGTLIVDGNTAALELGNACPQLRIFRRTGDYNGGRKWVVSSRHEGIPIFGCIG